MNFAAVKLNIDVKDNKNYPLRIDMPGMITEFSGGSKVTIMDQAGEKHTVYINGDVPPNTLMNQWLTFSLGCANKVHRSSGQPYVGFSGFWQNRTPQQAPPQQAAPPYQPPQQAPQGGYQSPPQAQQAPISPPSTPNYPPAQNQATGCLRMPDTYAYPVTPETQRRMARSVALEAASRVSVGRAWPNVMDEVLNIASTFYSWLETGNIPAEEPEEEDTNPDF